MSKAAPTQHKPGPIQVGIILASVCLSVLVTAILGPSLPKMQMYFESVEGVERLVPLSLTSPMLVMALFGLAAGLVVDRVGRKWVLVGASFMYGVVGTAPIYLDNLHAILASRILLGVAEILIAVVSVALIGDFFVGKKRGRLLALQATVAAFTGFVLNNLGGLLGDISWRAPYWIYAVGFLLAILSAIFLWEPERRTSKENSPVGMVDEPTIDRFMITVTCVLSVVAGFVFMTVPINFSFLFHAIGVDSSARIGFAYGLNGLGIIAGSLLFGWVLNGRSSVPIQLGIAFLMTASGFIGMWYSTEYAHLAIAGVFAGIGGGMLFPSMATWNISLLPSRIRGLGQGAFQSAGYLGQFSAGIAIIWLASLLGQRVDAIKWLGISLAIAAAIAFSLGRFRLKQVK